MQSLALEKETKVDKLEMMKKGREARAKAHSKIAGKHKALQQKRSNAGARKRGQASQYHSSDDPVLTPFDPVFRFPFLTPF